LLCERESAEDSERYRAIADQALNQRDRHLRSYLQNL
jgi:hypothetical protein